MRNLKEKMEKIAALLMRCFPIKKNKVFMMSYYGKSYDCSPKYLTEYIKANHERYKWEIVWAFNEPKRYENLTGVKCVKTMSLRYFYALYTAKVIVTNYRMTEQFSKRAGQYYIQTWHSSLRLKQIEKDAEQTLTPAYRRMAIADSRQCDLLLSGCQYSTHIFSRAFWYTGKILACGTPRNDYLIAKDTKKQECIKAQIGIVRGQRVVLYAPTFRKGHDLSMYDLDYSMLQKVLSEAWGGVWTILVRLHPHLNSDDLKIVWSDTLIDASKWDDIQELLSIADVLVSDYSSLMFDFSITTRPCFLYIPDLEQYIAEDRGLYFDINQLPFEAAKTHDALYQSIKTFNAKRYKEKIDRFNQQIGSYERGKACQKVVRHMDKVIKAV